VRYCRLCITPDSRPNIIIDEEGVCSACRNFATKPQINWKQREVDFRKLVDRIKKRSRGYDCLIPVSGGKDSTWQVLKCLAHGLRILAYTWRPPGRTDIGQKNLDNLKRLGVDHIDFTVSPAVEKKFAWAAFRRFGSHAIPMHLGIYSTPLRLAVDMGIPLVIYGENSAFEYGNAEDAACGARIDANWLQKYGVTHGTSAKDWVGHEGLTEKDLSGYLAPDLEKVERAGVRAVFLGYYFEWDVETSLSAAAAAGFVSSEAGPRTGIYNYADIDDDFISIHHWMKWLKFGFTRSFDNLSLEIRNGRIRREQAVGIIHRLGDEYPRADIERFCRWLGVTLCEFTKTAESFRNPLIWKRDRGVWKIPGFLVNNWSWQ
jgi:N-acetyl sugar amidotransferase